MKENTLTIPIFDQRGKLFCPDCKPSGKSTKGILVVSSYDQFCAGCGEDFKVMAELRHKEAAITSN